MSTTIYKCREYTLETKAAADGVLLRKWYKRDADPPCLHLAREAIPALFAALAPHVPLAARLQAAGLERDLAMKFTVTMKDPDTLRDAINEAVDASLAHVADADEKAAVAEVRGDKVNTLCARWFKWGEYLTVEIDTEAETCTVVGADR